MFPQIVANFWPSYRHDVWIYRILTAELSRHDATDFRESLIGNVITDKSERVILV